MTNILTIDELKNSVLNANIDDEYIQPAIDEAQSIYLREILGDALLNAIINKINDNNLTGKYLTLVNDYVKPYLTYMVQSIIVVPITYKIRNAGVVQQYDNGFTTTQMKDTQYLKDYYDGKAEFYGNRLTEWLRKNANDIVEYRLSASNVTNPTTSQNVTNIFLGGTKRGKCGGVSTSSSGGGGTHDTVDWNNITNRPDFATVATSGSYNDLSNKPEIPSLDGYATEQWVENQGYSTFSGSYNDLSDKPEIPTVNNGTLTIKQGGVAKGTFTANSNENIEINLEAGGSGSTDWNDIENKPDFSTVATSGSYDDLSDKPDIPAAQVNADWNASSGVQQILNKPDLDDYVRVIDYEGDKQSIDTALANKVETDNLCRINNERLDTNSNFELVRTDSIATLTITQGGVTKGTFTPDSGTNVTINLEAGESGGSTDWNDIQNKPNFATVATTGSYNDLNNKPDMTHYVEDTDLSTVATSGDYNDLSNKPDLTHYVEATDLAQVATSGSYNDLSNKPDLTHYVEDTDLATVATSGDYNDLSNKPTIPTMVQADWSETDTTADDYIKNKPNLAQVATSGDYRDLSNTPNLSAVATSNDYRDLDNRPTIVTPVNANWNEADQNELSYIKNKPNLATVATSGDYRDLSNTPNLAAVATSGDYHDLTHTPNLSAVATSNDYDDLDNKPTIPTVNNGSLTIQLNGTTVATFTANDNTDQTANIKVPTDETDLGLTSETWTFTLQDNTTVTKTVVLK